MYKRVEDGLRTGELLLIGTAQLAEKMQINNMAQAVLPQAQEQPAGHQVVGQWLQFPLWNTLNVETVSHNVALYFYLDISLSSRRAKRASWPKGLKGPRGRLDNIFIS